MILKSWCVGAIAGFLASSAVASERDIGTAVLVGLVGSDGADRLFYYPTKDQPITPKDRGYAYEDVFFPASDGVRLHGWWLPGKGKRKGATVVYSHGNAGSVAYHLPFVTWLVDAGYNVLLYDYRGFGRSAGVVSKAGVVRDAQAAFAYANARKDCGGLYAFGHSLGGAKSIAALGLNPPARLKGVIVDSTFASYQDMAAHVLGERGRKVVSNSYDPVQFIKKLSNFPLLIVHGTADKTIPFTQAQKLFDEAGPLKKLVTVAGANHVNCFFIEGKKYQRVVLQWMEDAASLEK